MQEKKLRLTWFSIALLYIGFLMGAGFASGKELWQFFGVFGDSGLFGILLASALFMALGCCVVYISRKKKTEDMASIIYPGKSGVFQKVIRFCMALFLFSAYFSMIAAGGSVFREQFGIPSYIGSLVLTLLTLLVAIKGFGRVSKVLGKVVPVLLVVTLILTIVILIRQKDVSQPGIALLYEPSLFAQNWIFSAFVYVGYNIIGAVVMLSNGSANSRSRGHAYFGAVAGGLFLGIFALLIHFVMLTDPTLAAGRDLPMLAFVMRVNPVIQWVYGIILLAAIFNTSTGAFFGTVSALPKKRSWIWAVAIALAGYLVSLLGFSNIVAIFYPLEGYISLVFICLMVIQFFLLLRKK